MSGVELRVCVCILIEFLKLYAFGSVSCRPHGSSQFGKQSVGLLVLTTGCALIH